MRWLLLTDLHIGLNNESQKLAIDTLVDAIRTRSKNVPFDLVLMTGDLAFSGKASEYSQLRDVLINPLRNLDEYRNARFVAVPGNHDVDCDLTYPPSLSTLGPKKSEQFFHLDDSGNSLRKTRSASFAAYSDFLVDAAVEGVDPTKVPGSIVEIATDTTDMQLICVVTSYFSSNDLPQEKHHVPAPLHPIRYLLTNAKKCPYRFVVAHHPPDWFTPETQQRLESLLVEQDAVYVHGHEHRIQARFGRKGLTSLGFGAAYQASLETNPTPYYRNSFAICELRESLHIAVTAWDSENGTWVAETVLPANFDARSDVLENGRVLPLPTSLLRDRSASTSRHSIAITPTMPHLAGCYWLAKDSRNRWLKILYELGLVDVIGPVFRPSTHSLAESHIELRITERGTHRLIHAVSGHGDVFSYDQIVTLNTLLDSEQLSSCIVVTLGEFADDAMTLVNRLSTTKSIHAIDREGFERLWITRSTSPLVGTLKSMDVSAVSATLLIRDTGYALMIMDLVRNEWLQIIDEDRNIFPEAHELVFQLRQEFPSLTGLDYRTDPTSQIRELVANSEVGALNTFRREEYLTEAHKVFDDVRYAPLAALGFRFRNASLSDIYIETSADTGGANKSAQTLQRAVSEYVESLNMDRSLRDQLETQLRSRYGLGRGAEVGFARQLYQRYGNIVVLGDPGSGKTCFVKYEILAYCKPPSDGGSWYQKHLPIYIPLAEAAELLRSNREFLSACVVIAARRKLEISEHVIRQYLSDGRVAIFFDGLDEVGRINERVKLLAIVEELVSKYARYGNRFVLTSRPAAIQPVDIPDAFTYLHLKGLTDHEIRILAERVLTTRLGVSEEEILATEEQDVVERLLEHVRSTPGLRRISRNPLLLTLLVLIYANTGTLSARRHVVYTQAVKTLVSYRHRETMEQILPEADLRTRLGRLAYAIYNRDVSELPSRSQVVSVLLQDGANSRKQIEDANGEAEEFLRRVAEATGLLVLHSRDGDGDPDENVISFMHHSFLEYYAAVGFLARDFSSEIPGLASHPHWRDVITLIFGLLSEHNDISGLLEEMVEHESDLEAVTNERLRLGFECALECEVPPRESQELLAKWLSKSLKSGALRHSEQLRESMAALVDRLLASAGVEVFEPMLCQGVVEEQAPAAAAFIDFVGRLSEASKIGTALVERFEETFDSRKETVVRAACAGAIMRRPEFRTERSLERLRRCLKGNVVEKHAGIKAIENNPGLAREFQTEMAALLDDTSQLIATSAAHCILVAGLSREQFESRSIAVRKAVAKWQSSDRILDVGRVTLRLHGSFLQKLLDSEDVVDVAFSASLVPLGEFNSNQAHKLLIGTLRKNTNHQVIKACLDALRSKDGALDLITLAETDYICSLVNSNYRDVRIGAIKVLAKLPNDEQVVSTLLSVCGIGVSGAHRGRQPDEVEEGIRALTEHARKDAALQRVLVDDILSALPDPKSQQFGDAERQMHVRSMLVACEKIGAVVDERRSAKLLELAKSFRTPKELRAQALRVYGRTVRPHKGCVGELIFFLERDEVSISEASYAAVFWFLAQCRKRVEYSRSVYAELPQLRSALIDVWLKEKERVLDRIDSVGIEDIRRSLSELESIIVSYSEFSERMKLAEDGLSQ